jgi:hypothetical protein
MRRFAAFLRKMKRLAFCWGDLSWLPLMPKCDGMNGAPKVVVIQGLIGPPTVLEAVYCT